MNAQLLQAVQLVWSPGLRVIRAEGDCSAVLRRSASELVDVPLHVALGTTPEKARELDARAREDRRAVEFISARIGTEEPAPLRLVLGMQAGEPTAVIQDLDALLEG